MKASEDIFTTRSIRALILKNAETNLVDINANLAEDYLKDFDMSQPYMKEFVDEIYEIL